MGRKENQTTQNGPNASRIIVNIQRQISDSYGDHPECFSAGLSNSEAEPQLLPRKAAMSLDRER